MKQLLLLVAVLFLSFQAEAISLRFKFKVYSSGPDMYACNAGLVSQQSNKRVCYFEGTQNVCEPDSCSTAKGNCQSSCVCSGGNGGDYLLNYGKVKVKDWTDHHQTSTGNGTAVKFGGLSSSQQALDDVTSWNKVISDLTFNLGSELYTARYFVDICYRGSQHNYFKDGINGNWTLAAQAAGVNFLSTGGDTGENNRNELIIPEETIKYIERAGVKVQAFTVCDFQGVGNYVDGAATGITNDATKNEASFLFAGTGLPNGASEGAGSFFSSVERPVTADGVELLNESIVSNSSKAPRYCKIRYVFTETNYTATKPNLRSWLRHGAEMCTYTKIEEDAVASQSQSPLL